MFVKALGYANFCITVTIEVKYLQAKNFSLYD